MIQREATSLRQVEDFIASILKDDMVCFRGQSSADWDLIPSAYRVFPKFANDTDSDLTWTAQVERDTYREFELEAERDLDRSLDILERISRAQHHGVPTRLLDWTANSAIGAYFAVFGGKQGEAALWCLNLSQFPFSDHLGRQHRGGGFRIENIYHYGKGVVASFAQEVSKPIIGDIDINDDEKKESPAGTFIVWKPKRVDARLQRQEGLLSWYHSFNDEDVVWNYSDYIQELEVQNQKDLLLKILIPDSARISIQKEILDRGINEFFLFDDLDGLGRYLSRKHHEEMIYYATP